MILTLVLLAVAHYLVHTKSRKKTAGTNKVVLWLSTAAALAMLSYSLLNGRL